MPGRRRQLPRQRRLLQRRQRLARGAGRDLRQGAARSPAALAGLAAGAADRRRRRRPGRPPGVARLGGAGGRRRRRASPATCPAAAGGASSCSPPAAPSTSATLRGVAWPEAGRAYAVGDLGAMWQWNAADDLWIADPGVPIGFEGNLMDVAFDPADPIAATPSARAASCSATARAGSRTPLPPGFADRRPHLDRLRRQRGDRRRRRRPAGQRRRRLAGRRLRPRRCSTASARRPAALFAVAGLPDGGAVAAGRDIVIERDGGPARPGASPDQPLPGSTAIAAAAVRADGAVRAVVSVVPQLTYPPADDLPRARPDVPPPILPPFAAARRRLPAARDRQPAGRTSSGPASPAPAPTGR